MSNRGYTNRAKSGARASIDHRRQAAWRAAARRRAKDAPAAPPGRPAPPDGTEDDSGRSPADREPAPTD